MKTRRCKVYYFQLTKLIYLRAVLWPDKRITATKVRIDKNGDERTLEIYQ
jgi:hypothetical protein